LKKIEKDDKYKKEGERMIIRESVFRRLIKEIYEELEQEDTDLLTDEEVSRLKDERAEMLNDPYFGDRFRSGDWEYPGVEKTKWWGKDNFPVPYDKYEHGFNTYENQQIDNKRVLNSLYLHRDLMRWKIQKIAAAIRNSVDEKKIASLQYELKKVKEAYEHWCKHVNDQKYWVDLDNKDTIQKYNKRIGRRIEREKYEEYKKTDEWKRRYDPNHPEYDIDNDNSLTDEEREFMKKTELNDFIGGPVQVDWSKIKMPKW
jgi:hypothetical protein